jgi:Fe-S-cluster-containing dehydrogenase component
MDRCIGCKLCAWACPYGAREFDEDEGVMKKCTLCVDRVYNDNLAPAERVPVCVATCPTKARHFGDFNDPESDVSRLVRERDGFDLMPELGYQPTSKYLPLRPRRSALPEASQPEAPSAARDRAGGFLRWVDRVLSR